MPSNRIQWSVLIWTIFLGLFIAVFFITFQSRLEQYFSQTKNEQWILQDNLALTEVLESLTSKPQSSLQISDTENLENDNFDGSVYTFSLPEKRAMEFRLTNTGSVAFLNAKILSGGPLKYSIADVTTDIVQKWDIFTMTNIPLFSSNKQILYIENLWGLTRFSLWKWPTDAMPMSTSYTRSKKRWDISEKEWTYVVKHFLPENAFPEAINKYNSYGMYLNAKSYEQ